MGTLYVYEPMTATNLVANPSVETNTTGCAAYGSGASIAQSYTEAAFGICSLEVATGGSTGRGATLATSAGSQAAGTTYVASLYAKANAASAGLTLSVLIDWYNSSNASISQTTATTCVLTTDWQRIENSGTAPANTSYCRMRATSGSASRTFYLDAAQVEVGDTATSYVDGDQPGCSWSGYAHGSTSTRSSQFRAGGRLRIVDSYCGVSTTNIVGLGALPYDLLDRQYSTLPGNVVDGYRQSPRDMTIICVLKEPSLSAYHATRRKLLDLFMPGRVYPPTQPLRLRYVSGTKTVEFDAYYVGGLEGAIQGGSGNYEKVAIQLRAADPFVYGIDGFKQTLMPAETISTNFNSFVSNETGVWANFGTISPTTAKINTAIQYADGWIIGGSFTNLGGYASADNLAKISNAGSVTALAGGSVNGEVFKIVEVPNTPNNWWVVCGAFTSAGGTAATQGIFAIDQGNFQYISIGGVGGTVYDAVVATGNSLYVAGNFGSANTINPGVAKTNHFARYNFYSGVWQSVHDGTISANGTASPTHCRAVAFDGLQSIMVGGYFSKIGGLSCSNLAAYQEEAATWVSCGSISPVGGLPLSIATRGDGDYYVVGGSAFGSVSGVAVSNIARRQSGVWDALGPGLNGKVNDVRCEMANGLIYAAGSFTDGATYSVGGLAGLAYFDSSWHSAGLALPAGDLAQCIEFVNRRLVGGNLYVGLNGAGTVQGIARATVTVDAAMPCYPKIHFPYLSGISGTPVVKSITNETTGQSILLEHTLSSGETFTVDCDYQADPLKGPSSMRKKLYKRTSGVTTDLPGDLQSGSDLAGFMLAPGTNVISVLATDTSGTAGSAVVQYRNTYDSGDV